MTDRIIKSANAIVTISDGVAKKVLKRHAVRNREKLNRFRTEVRALEVLKGLRISNVVEIRKSQ